MRYRNKFILLALFLILLSPIHVFAADAGGNGLDVGSWVIVKGLEGFTYRVGDMIYGVGDGDSRNSTQNRILQIITYNVDPYSYPEIQMWRDYTMMLYVIISILLLFFVFVVNKIDISVLDKFFGNDYASNRLYSTIFYIISIPMIAHYGVWVILKLNQVISMVIADYLVLAIPPTANNFIVYILLSITSLGLILVFLVRDIIILITTVLAFLIVIAFFAQDYRTKIKEILYSFIKIVFLQARLLFYFSIGVIFINNLSGVFSIIKPFAYLALSLYILKIGYESVLGDSNVKTIKSTIMRTI